MVVVGGQKLAAQRFGCGQRRAQRGLLAAGLIVRVKHQANAWLGALAAILILVGGYLSFDYAQHGAPQQPKPKAKPQAPKQAGPQRRPKPASRAGVWDDADFE